MFRPIHTLAMALAIVLSPGITLGQMQPAATPDTHDPQQVLAHQGSAVLTQQGIDAAFSRIPEEHRLAFIRDGAKVDQLVQSLLQAKIVAADARENGFADDPQVRERLQQALDKELAEAWLQEVARRAPEADYEALAREDYLANPEAYSTPLTLDVSHILIGTESRTPEEAEGLAARLKSELDGDPARFDALVLEYSDDPAKSKNQGRYSRMKKGEMVKTFEDAAFAMTSPGQISGPVKTEYGFHLIRLDARKEPVTRPWEKVKDEAVQAARTRHIGSYRTRYVQKLLAEPIVIPEGAVGVMARRHFGDTLEKAPVFTE
jgi:peptidyl-prolyl cis-trans isomerase C